MKNDSDELLADLAIQGDKDAFTVLVHRHIDSLYGYAMRLTRSGSSADDLVQDTWLAAWRAMQGFNPNKATLSTWLHRILHNKYIDGMRKSKLTYDSDKLATLRDPYDAEQAQTNTEHHERLETLISKLPQNQKAAVALTYAQGFSNAEVAHILGLRLRAVESLLARARKSLVANFAALGQQTTSVETSTIQTPRSNHPHEERI